MTNLLELLSFSFEPFLFLSALLLLAGDLNMAILQQKHEQNTDTKLIPAITYPSSFCSTELY